VGDRANKEGVKISLHPLEGCLSEKIIKIKGMVGKKEVIVLINSGSIHSFLDEDMTKELKCLLQATLS